MARVAVQRSLPALSGTRRVEEDLQPIRAQVRPVVISGTAEFGDRRGHTPGFSVGLKIGPVDIGRPKPSRPVAAEVELRVASVFEVAARALLVERGVDVRAEVGWRLPIEVVVDVDAVRLVEIDATERSGGVPGRGLAKKSQCPSEENAQLASSDAELTMDRRFTGDPQAALTLGSVRDPKITTARTTRPVAVEIEAQAVRGKTGVRLGGRGVDRRSHVHRNRPVRKDRRRSRERSNRDSEHASNNRKSNQACLTSPSVRHGLRHETLRSEVGEPRAPLACTKARMGADEEPLTASTRDLGAAAVS